MAGSVILYSLTRAAGGGEVEEQLLSWLEMVSVLQCT
jgi:hypothetical protein